MGFDLMAARREMMLQSKRIQVLWNQLVYPVSNEAYTYYKYNEVTFEGNVAISTWKSRGGSYNYSVFTRNDYRPVTSNGKKYYISYMLMPDFDNGAFSVEWLNNVIPTPKVCIKNVWNRFSAISTSAQSGTSNNPYLLFVQLRNYTSTTVQEGNTCKFKSPILICLTDMYGAGNEPDLVTFERQCAMNGINLTEYQTLNVSGTQRWWII